MERKFLKPANEIILVRDPVSKKHLDKQGEEKVMSNYWARRIMSGDVVVSEKPAPSKVEAKKQKSGE